MVVKGLMLLMLEGGVPAPIAYALLRSPELGAVCGSPQMLPSTSGCVKKPPGVGPCAELGRLLPNVIPIGTVVPPIPVVESSVSARSRPRQPLQDSDAPMSPTQREPPPTAILVSENKV